MRDAYDELFLKYPKENFFKDGLKAIIFVHYDKLWDNWNQQKKKLISNGDLFIRGYGRDAKGTDAFFMLYEKLFDNNNIKKDASNNDRPTRILTELTGFCKKTKSDRKDKERIQNYQVSHLFGRTKNPLLFTAAWNIAYIPKYIDPLTGHETQGDHNNEFREMFRIEISGKFQEFIDEYNLFIEKRVEPYLEDALMSTKKEIDMPDNAFNNFKKDAMNELSKIIKTKS